MPLLYTFIIIVVSIIVIIVTLLAITRLTLLAGDLGTPFTYGDFITIQNVATNGYLIPGLCPDSSKTTLVSVSINPTSDIVSNNIWRIVPPQITQGETGASGRDGYVLQHYQSKRVMKFAGPGTGTPLVAVENTAPSQLYGNPQYKFRLQGPAILRNSLSAGNDDVYLITHIDQGSTQQLVTVGNLNLAPDLNAPCYNNIPTEIETRNTGIILTSRACTGKDKACVRFFDDVPATATFDISLRTFKITKVSPPAGS